MADVGGFCCLRLSDDPAADEIAGRKSEVECSSGGSGRKEGRRGGCWGALVFCRWILSCCDDGAADETAGGEGEVECSGGGGGRKEGRRRSGGVSLKKGLYE